MKQEIEDDLFSRYPALFANKDSRGSPMIFGCEHGDGWESIVRRMCDILSQDASVRLTQVKEKYGTLRVYHSGGNDFHLGVIAMAEAMSGYTCERCGQPGHTRGTGWLYTLCDGCEEKR